MRDSQATDNIGHTVSYTYDAPVVTQYTHEPQFFQLATVTDPLQHTWTVGYNPAGHIASITDPHQWI